MNRPRQHNKHLPRNMQFRHGAHWHVKNGRWTRLPKKGPSTLKAALAAYAAIHEGPSGEMSKLIDAAMPHILAKVAASTRIQYERCAKRLKKWLQEFTPAELKPRDVAAMKLQLAKTPNYANQSLSLLRQIFDFAVEQQLIDSNPAAEIKRLAEGKRDRLISMEEYAAIYSYAGPRLQVIMDLCVRTGQRITAVLQIKRADLLEEGIRFPHHKTKTKGVVKWTPELREVVDRARGLSGNVLALTLLHNRRGKAPDYSTVKIQWDKACKAAKVADAHMHDLRAVAATWAEKQGLNATKLLQHSSPAQTRRYLRGKEEPVTEGPSFGQSKSKG